MKRVIPSSQMIVRVHPRPSRPLLTLLLLLLLTWTTDTNFSLLLGSSSARAVQGQNIVLSNNPVTGPYESPSSADTAAIATSTLTITSPPELVGTLLFAQAPFNGQLFTVNASQAAAGDFNVVLPIVLPHSADDRYACSSFTHPLTDEGQPLNGSIVLIERRGGCAFAAKGLNVDATGAAAIAIHNCPGCGAGYIRIGVPDSEKNVNMFLTMSDGYTIRNYLQARRDYLANVTLYGSYPMPAGHNYNLPVMCTVVGTGPMDPTELAAFKQIATEMPIAYPTLSDTSALRPWSDLAANPNLDPCLNRMVGIYCERGRIQSIYLRSLMMTGSFSSSWSAFTALKYLTMDENKPDTIGFTGSLPTQFCQLTQLLSIELEGNSLTSLPNCLGTSLTNLQVLLVERNSLTTLPTDVSGLTSLVWFTANANSLTTLPPTISLWTNIVALDISSNFGLSVDLSTSWSFNGWFQVYSLGLSNCALKSSSSIAGAFNNLPTLSILDMSHNSLSGPLPAFNGSTGLTTLNFAYNNFIGDLPSSWTNLKSVVTLQLDHNALTGLPNGLSSMAGMTSLSIAHFEHNKIVIPPTLTHFGQLLFYLLEPSLTELYLDYNSISGAWVSGFVDQKTFSKFYKISVSYNQITSVPDDLFDGEPFTYVDLSYNALTGGIPSDLNQDITRPFITLFNVEGNLGLDPIVTGTPPALPPWLQPALPAASFTSSDGYYLCPVLGSASYSAFRFTFSPILTSYLDCTCVKGRFGQPPNCDIVPVEATISPYGNHVTSNETALQATSASLFSSLLIGYDTAPNGFINSSIISSSDSTVLPPTFKDSWYGSDRLTVGLNTYFTVDLSNVRRHLNNQTELYNFPPVSANTISGLDPNQPVRTITIRLHISATYFSGIGNAIVVQAGTHDSPGEQLKSITGSGFSQLYTTVNSSFTRSPEYQSRYGSQLSSLSDPRLVEVQVLGSSAFVSFSSRDSANNHFVGTYSYSFACPTGLELDSSNFCSVPTHSSNMLLILATVAGCLLLITFCWLLRERVIRQRAKQNKHRELFSLKASDLGQEHMTDDLNEVELSQSQYDKIMQKEHAYSMKKEFVVTIVMIVIECGFVTTTWLNVNSLIGSISSNNVSLAYLVIAVVSSMAFLVNDAAKILGLIALWNDIQREQMDTQDNRTYQLIKLERKILRLKITTVGLIFDSIPVVSFNFYRLYTGSSDLQKIISLVLGAFLLGLKVARISEFSTMKKERLKIQYDIYQAKKLAIEQNRRTSIVNGKRMSIINLPTTTGLNSPKPIMIDSPSHTTSPNGDTINLHIPSSMVDTITTTKSIESNHSTDLPTPLIRQSTTSPKSKSFRIFQMEKSCQLCAQAHKREGHAVNNQQQQPSRTSPPINAHIQYHSPNGNGLIKSDHAVEMTSINAPSPISSPPTSPTPPPAYILPTTVDRRRSIHITDAYIEDLFGPSNGDTKKL